MTEESPFAKRAYLYIERGYSVIPIAPGTKRPGQYDAVEGWRGMRDWERFGERLPTEIEVNHWETWPDAGIGLLCGKVSGIVGLDRDYDAPGTDALEQIIPPTLIKKKGEKGYTAFYRYNGEKSCSFNIGGVRVMDVLSDGRQTLMPGTIHPNGHTYVYLTLDVLEELDPTDLPILPEDFFDQVARVLAPYQTAEDRKYQRRNPIDNDEPINTDLSIAAGYYRDLNREALNRLDEWVPMVISTAVTHHDGYRCVATWRNCTNPNVGVHHNGIFDFGGNYGMTPIDLVMYSHGVSFADAANVLRDILQPKTDYIELTASGYVSPQPVGRVSGLPWENKVPAAAEPPPVVILPPTPDAEEPAQAIPNFVLNPPGMLGEIARWIGATAPKHQPELAVAAAVALGATVTQRIYRSSMGNFTSLYVVMVAKSTEGKEYPQAAVELILEAAGMGKLVAGSGYTSAGAVFSALLKSPSHIAIIDEMGKLLKMSRSKGNSNSEAAIDKLVEAFGKLDGVIRPPVYSSMTLKKHEEVVERVIYNPAITLLGATTPGTFYGNLTDDLVQDGFLGRLLVIESTQPRQLVRHDSNAPPEPPAKIVEWCKAVNDPMTREGNLAGLMSPEMKANTIPMHIDDACKEMLRKFELELNQLKDQFEPEMLDVLLGRTFEKALRLAMIASKAVDTNATKVSRESIEWAISFVRHFDMSMIRAVRTNRIASQIDGDMKRAVGYVKHAKRYVGDKRYAKALAQGAMPRGKLLKLMKMKSRDFDQLIETALGSGVLKSSPGTMFGEVLDVYFVGDDE